MALLYRARTRKTLCQCLVTVQSQKCADSSVETAVPPVWFQLVLVHWSSPRVASAGLSMVRRGRENPRDARLDSTISCNV